MTIAIAWIRKLRDCEELVFVSDSRLSGDGLIFDGCPKILTLPRSDCAICFAGYTGHAFPMMLQLALAIDSHAPSQRGSLDLVALRTHALKVFDGMAGQISASVHVNGQQNVDPAATFLFGGYSWIKKRFQLWTISYDVGQRGFAAHPCKWLSYWAPIRRVILRSKRTGDGAHNLGRIAFAGDQATLAKRLLLQRLTGDGTPPDKPLDMEPFEVVRDMLRDPAHAETIGGAPLLVKVYQYMRSTTMGVYWPNKAQGLVHLQGRACLGYERVDRWVMDPDTLKSERQPTPVEPSVIPPPGSDEA